MYWSVAERMLGVIRVERERIRRDLEILAGEDHPYAADVAADDWDFHERPFINELCLLLLVSIRHEVERELVRIAARVGNGTVEAWRCTLRRKGGWEQLTNELQLKEFARMEWSDGNAPPIGQLVQA
jgi:hypothetical protein